MKQKLLYSAAILALWIASYNPLFAQKCGVSHEMQLQWLPRYLNHVSESQNTFIPLKLEAQKVPIVLHLVARDNGVGRATVERALNILCELNELYAASEISFYLTNNGLNFINNDDVFSSNQLTINQLVMEGERRDSALNIFVVNTVGANNVVGLYDKTKDWILIQRSVFLEGDRTLAHEIGHFFSLLHPHFGWDASPWNSSIHSNPASSISPDGQTPTERMDGTNCETAGDFICDTPPDYNFGINWQTSCEYTGTALSPDNIEVNPDESLIMSYFNDSCRLNFSDQQMEIMRLDLASESRAFLRPSDVPANIEITNSINLATPMGMTGIVKGEKLEFEWESVAEASSYYIEFDRSPNFNLDVKGRMTPQNSISIAHDWLSDLTYYWRVFAWNSTSFCGEPSATGSFSVDFVSSINEPSPQNYAYFHHALGKSSIEYELSESQSVKLEIFGLDGRTYFSKSRIFPIGKGNHALNLSNLQSGIYIVVITIGEKTNLQRIFIDY